MVISSSLAGGLTRLINLIQSALPIARYSSGYLHNVYTVDVLQTKTISVYRLQVTATTKDKITFIKENAPLALFYLLAGKVELTGGQLSNTTLSGKTFTLLYTPLFHFDLTINANSICDLIIVLCPSDLLPEDTHNNRATKFIHARSNKNLDQYLHDLLQGNDTQNICSKIIAETFVISDKQERNFFRLIDEVKIEAVKVYVNENVLSRYLSIKNIAKATKVNPRLINSQFSKIEKKSLHRYVIIKKLEVAAQKLKEKDTIVKNIPREIGMTSSTFYKQFKKHYHMAPDQYRSSHFNAG